MTLPQVKQITPFEPHNVQLCSVMFEGPVSPAQQQKLQNTALEFRPQKDGASVHFFLLFGENSCSMIVRQRIDSSRVPTKQEGSQLLEKLGITELIQAASSQTIAAQPGRMTQPARAAA